MLIIILIFVLQKKNLMLRVLVPTWHSNDVMGGQWSPVLKVDTKGNTTEIESSWHREYLLHRCKQQASLLPGCTSVSSSVNGNNKIVSSVELDEIIHIRYSKNYLEHTKWSIMLAIIITVINNTKDRLHYNQYHLVSPVCGYKRLYFYRYVSK